MTKTETLIEAGLGLAALAALGTYFLYGKKNEPNREKISGWMLKLKGEVLEKVEEVKALNEQEYYNIVDEVAGRYARLRKVGVEELNPLTMDLKGAWAHLGKELMR